MFSPRSLTKRWQRPSSHGHWIHGGVPWRNADPFEPVLGHVVARFLCLRICQSRQIDGTHCPVLRRAAHHFGALGVCAGPILGSVLAVAAAGGNPLYGGIMLAIFALGMALPLGIMSLLWTRLRLGERSWLKPRRLRLGPWENSVWMVVSGVLSIGIGVLLLATQGTSSLGGLLTIDGHVGQGLELGVRTGCTGCAAGGGRAVPVAHPSGGTRTQHHGRGLICSPLLAI